MEVKCIHSCRGRCATLDAVEQQETEIVREYNASLQECNYPDVRELLQELIVHHEKALKTLREKRSQMNEAFHILDDINESFS
jgi:hypothetical protein